MADRRQPAQEMIPLAVPDLRGDEMRYLEACVRDNWISSSGPYVGAFEERMAALTGRRAAVACVNGTAALQVALTAAGIGPGDRVLVPDWTFAATANAVVHAGATPVFADVSADDWCLDPRAAEAACARHAGHGLKAIMAVDALGNMPDPAPLRALARRHGLVLIEDAAGAIGAARDGLAAGGIGDLAVFSFNGNKTVTAGGGGMIVLDDDDLAARLRHLTTQARVGREYRYDAVGFNHRMTNVNAAIGLAQMERIEALLEGKRRAARAYRDALHGRDDIRFMPVPRPDESSYWLSSVLVADEDSAHALVDHLEAHGAVARVFWRALSDQPPYAGYPKEPTPVSRALTGRVVSLPCSSHLAEEERARVVDALAAWRGPRLEGRAA